jgi:multicomponent Na+:H+ antiporter subunit F
VVLDTRDAPYPWIPESAPATGWRLRGSASYTIGAGDNDGAGDTRFARWGASAERLFDLFHGTRVLILRAPDTLHRVLALDVLVSVLIMLLTLLSFQQGVSYYIDAAIGLALLSFTATLVAARHVLRGRPFR